jgi:hypothetical protein
MITIYLEWFCKATLTILLLPTTYVAAPIISLFTKAEKDTDTHSWGGWYGTYDNPPQGDRKYVRSAFYPGETTGFKGYVNRIGWLLRNKLYNLKKKFGKTIKKDSFEVVTIGNENVSDKYKIPGSYFSVYRVKGEPQAFEYYSVFPWSKNKCIRCRLGWKITTDKFDEINEFAPLVLTFNPIDTYGDQ